MFTPCVVFLLQCPDFLLCYKNSIVTQVSFLLIFNSINELVC